MSNDKRVALYRKIQVGLKQLPHMDDDVYRNMLKENFGQKVKSRKDLTISQLTKLINILTLQGAVFTKNGNNRKSTPHVRPDWMEIPDGAPYAELKRNICAIWRKLGYSMTSLETRVKRQFGTATLLWVHDKNELSALLTDLQKRECAFDKKQAGAVSENNA